MNDNYSEKEKESKVMGLVSAEERGCKENEEYGQFDNTQFRIINLFQNIDWILVVHSDKEKRCYHHLH